MSEEDNERESSGLSPELQEVLSRALRNYQEGGLAAVETMMEDMAAEADAAGAIADSGRSVMDEAIELQDVLDQEQVTGAVSLVSELEQGHITDMSKRSFALWLLETLRDIEARGPADPRSQDSSK